MRTFLAAAALVALAACSQGETEATDEATTEDTATTEEDAGDAETEGDTEDAATDTEDATDEGTEVEGAPDQAAAEPEPEPTRPERVRWTRIVITGFECGDNCYLSYSLRGGGEESSALCSVGPCQEWFEFQEMPASMIGRRARIKLGSGQQFDGGGNVMSDDFPEITEIQLR